MWVARQQWVMKKVSGAVPEPRVNPELKPGEFTLARVAYERQLLAKDILSKARCKILSEARQEIAGTLFEFGWTKARIAKFLRRDWWTINYLLEKHNARQQDQRNQLSPDRVGERGVQPR